MSDTTANGPADVGHPLNGESVKFNADNGCIDFDQFCTLMVFCHKLAAK